MPNKCSDNGGTFHFGTVSHGTMRPQDLLASFAAEFERLLPFNSRSLVEEARELLPLLEQDEVPPRVHEQASELINVISDELDAIAGEHGAWFGASEGDGSDFGFWAWDEQADD